MMTGLARFISRDAQKKSRETERWRLGTRQRGACTESACLDSSAQIMCSAQAALHTYQCKKKRPEARMGLDSP